MSSWLGAGTIRDGRGSMFDEGAALTTVEELMSAGSRTRSQCDDDESGTDDGIFRERRG